MSMREYCTKMYGAYVPTSVLSYDPELLESFLLRYRDDLSEPLSSSVRPGMGPDELDTLVAEYEDAEGSYAGVASIVADVVSSEQRKLGTRPVVPVSAVAGEDGYAGLGVVPDEVYPWTVSHGTFEKSKGLTAEKAETVIGSYLKELGIEDPRFWYIDVVQYG